MRALTLTQPMGWAIVHGTKRIENRPRPLPKWMQGKRTLVALHSGKAWSDEYAETIERIMGPCHPTPTEPGIIGAMILTGQMFTANNLPLIVCGMGEYLDSWYSGPYGYQIEWAAALSEPIEVGGFHRGFWRLPEDVAARVRALRETPNTEDGDLRLIEEPT